MTNVDICFKVDYVVTFVVGLTKVEGRFVMNIFNVLFTKNFVINLILEIIFTQMSFILFQIIFNTHFSKKNHFTYVLLNTLGFTIGNLLDNSVYGYSFMLIFSIAFMFYQLKIPALKLFSFFSLFCIFILDFQLCIFKALSTMSICHSYGEMLQLPIYGIILTLCLSILGGIIYLALQYFKLNPLLHSSILENSNLIVGISLFNLLVIFGVFYFAFEKLSQHIFYILTLNIYFYFSLNFILHSCHSIYTKQKINNLKLCNKTILSMYDDTRAFKHDFHNILQAIGGYIMTNDIEGLKNYYTQISKDCITSNNFSKLNPELVNNPAIYNILADKYQMANTHNISVNLDVMLDLNKLNMNIYELTRILGILLDNAIEASKECNEKNINIFFKQDKQKQMLIIENTYNNKQISIDKIFEKDYTTKPHNTGLGLWEVKKILSRNTNLNLYTSKNHDYFSQQLEIYSA